MPDHTNVYKHEVERYDLLISKQSSLGDVIEKIRPFAGLDFVDRNHETLAGVSPYDNIDKQGC